jgi:hypothetical protein
MPPWLTDDNAFALAEGSDRIVTGALRVEGDKEQQISRKETWGTAYWSSSVISPTKQFSHL